MEDERKTRQTLIYNVKAAYYQVWLAQQMLKVAEASYNNLGRMDIMRESLLILLRLLNWIWLSVRSADD
jgi:hypothetical protein